MTSALTVIRSVAVLLIGSNTSTSMCGMFVFNSENSCCNEQDDCVRLLDGLDGTFNRCDESNAESRGQLCHKIPFNKHDDSKIPSSSGCGDSHCFCNASSILQTRTDWSRDHVISSISDEDWFRFGLHAKSSTTSVWPTKEQIGALCFELFHNSRLFSPRPRCGTITVTKPSANGCEKKNVRLFDDNKRNQINIEYRVSSSPNRWRRCDYPFCSSWIVYVEIFNSSILTGCC